MDFSNMSYNQIVSEKARLGAELEEIKREQRRHDEIIQAQRKAAYDKLPETVGLLHKYGHWKYCEFELSISGNTVTVEWHLLVSLAKDIPPSDEAVHAVEVGRAEA